LSKVIFPVSYKAALKVLYVFASKNPKHNEMTMYLNKEGLRKVGS
jgi:hypothetical protein